MRALSRFLAIAAMLSGSLLAAMPAANATDYYLCHVSRNSTTPVQDNKFCEYKFYMNGAKLVGNSIWYYEAQGTGPRPDGKWGDVYGDVFDTQADGQCAGSMIAKWVNGALDAYSPETTACGNGNDTRFEYEINRTFSFEAESPDPDQRAANSFVTDGTTDDAKAPTIFYRMYLCQPASACDPSGKSFGDIWTMLDKCSYSSSSCRFEWSQNVGQADPGPGPG
jgi:hypothetical protein